MKPRLGRGGLPPRFARSPLNEPERPGLAKTVQRFRHQNRTQTPAAILWHNPDILNRAVPVLSMIPWIVPQSSIRPVLMIRGTSRHISHVAPGQKPPLRAISVISRVQPSRLPKHGKTWESISCKSFGTWLRRAAQCCSVPTGSADIPTAARPGRSPGSAVQLHAVALVIGQGHAHSKALQLTVGDTS